MSALADLPQSQRAELLLLYEFAITPDVFDGSAVEGELRLEVILEQFLAGLCRNGMVASLDKGKWAQHVLGRISGLPKGHQAHRDRVISLLNRLKDRKRLVRHPKATAGAPRTDAEWLELAMESHQRMPLYGIVLSQHLAGARACDDRTMVELSGVLDSDLWANRRESISLDQCEAHFEAALGPLLRHARSLDLVDPHMTCRSPKFFDTVRLCTRLMGQRGHEPLAGLIRIHAGDPVNHGRFQESAEGRLDEWERQLRPLIAPCHPHRFEVLLWRQPPGGPRFHDRYILTDQFGISAPGGLDCNGSPTTWSLLDERDRVRHRRNYDLLTSPYELIGQREVR